VKERIFTPANMPTSKILTSLPESGVAHGYLNPGPRSLKRIWRAPTFVWSRNGGVWSSVENWHRYELALRQGVMKKDLLEHSRSTMHYHPWNDSVPRSLATVGLSVKPQIVSKLFLIREHKADLCGFADS